MLVKRIKDFCVQTPTPDIKHIQRMPTVAGFAGCDESMLRSYSILEKVKKLLHLKTDQKLILELIALMEEPDYDAKGEPIYKEITNETLATKDPNGEYYNF